MNKLALILGTLSLIASAGTSRADGIGLPVTGVLTTTGTTNYFNSSNGAVPSGYGNSSNHGVVVIGPGIEFGATNGQDLLAVDFTGTNVTVQDTCVGAGCGSTPFTIECFNPGTVGYTVSSINFPGITFWYGFDAGFGGDAGFVSFAGAQNFTGGTAVFDYTVSSTVPEPGTLGLMATGLLGVAGALRRRLTA